MIRAGARCAWRCGRYLALLGLALGCRRAPVRAYVGYAFPSGQDLAARVAQDAISAWAPASPQILVLADKSAEGSSPAGAVSRAERMAAIPGVAVVIGHDGSRASLAAAPVYNDAEVSQIVPTSTTRLLRRAGPWTFALADDDSVEGAMLSDFAVRHLHAQSVTIFYHNDEYGLGLRNGVQVELTRLGASVRDEVRYDTRSNLATLVEASFLRGQPDVVVVAGRQHEAAAIARLVTARRPGTPIVAGDGALVMPTLAREAGPAIDAIYVAAFWLPDSSARSAAFVARFRRLAGRDPDPFDAMTQDALLLAATAIRAVGPDRRAVRDYLASLGKFRPPYAGITGPIQFGGDRPSRMMMARVVDGRAVRVSP